MVKRKTLDDTGKFSMPRYDIFSGKKNNIVLADPDKQTLNELETLTAEYIDINKIVDNTKNTFKVANIKFLKESIAKLGLLQPIILVQLFDDEHKIIDKYEIRSGSRRFAALSSLYNDAVEANDEELKKKYGNAFSIVMPYGATEKEIEAVIVETNTTARQLSVQDLFKNFDFIFKKDDNGNYEYIPQNKNKYDSALAILEDMGFTFKTTSIKDYLSIYTAHNQSIREYFGNGFLNKKQAMTIARMPIEMQDETMKKFKKMTEKEIAQYIKDYLADKKENNNKKMKGSDALSKISNYSKKIGTLANKKEIIIENEIQKDQIKKEIVQIREFLSDLETKIDLN
jgi:hypothetical protein